MMVSGGLVVARQAFIFVKDATHMLRAGGCTGEKQWLPRYSFGWGTTSTTAAAGQDNGDNDVDDDFIDENTITATTKLNTIIITAAATGGDIYDDGVTEVTLFPCYWDEYRKLLQTSLY